jgi:deoxyribonuclease-4
MDDFSDHLGLDRLACIHVNDSQAPLGSNRDRHAPLGEGELGERGCSAFLSEPRFEELPAIFEGPGVEGKAPGAVDIARMRELRKKGLARRRRRAARAKK